jgi:hypothetical protein
MAKSAEHASRHFLAFAYRKRKFVREHALADRPHTSLWLAKTYLFPAGMYGSQVWGTGFLQAGREFSSSLSTFHLHFLKGTLGVKRSTTNWAVHRKCGHEPLQFYWFWSAVKLFNSMLTNSVTLRRVVQADLIYSLVQVVDCSIAECFSRTAWMRVICTSCSNWTCYSHARAYCGFEA